MKKLTLLFVSIALISITKAQDDFKKVRVGLNGSGNFCWLKPNIDGNYGYERKGIKLGYSAGIAFDFHLFGSNNYAFSTGLNLMQIGGKISYPDISIENPVSNANWTTTATYNLRYIDVPLTIKMKTNEIGYITYFGQVGLGLGTTIKARMSREQVKENGDVYKPADQNENVLTLKNDNSEMKQIAPFRVPLIVAAGIEYNLSGNTSLLVGLQFNNGFTNIFTSKATVYDLDNDGTVLFENGDPSTASGQKRNALTNFLALNLGLYF